MPQAVDAEHLSQEIAPSVSSAVSNRLPQTTEQLFCLGLPGLSGAPKLSADSQTDR